MGASLSLRCFNRFGSSLSVFGNCRFGSTVSVFDNLCLGTDKHINFEGWKIGWDAGNNKYTFLKDGVAQQPITITPTGGMLHGTWTVESIVSASDRFLKRE